MIAVCVGWRSEDPDRVAAWRYCRELWEREGFQVFTGDAPGTFNRSAARNAAARAAGNWDTAIFADSDVFPDSFDCLRDAANVAAGRGCWVNGIKRVGRLGRRVTRQVLTEGYIPSREDCDWIRQTPSPGGMVIIPRPLFEAVGGWDKGFIGWGYEDLALKNACRALGGSLYWGEAFGFHLWHDPSERKNASPVRDPVVVKEKEAQFERNRARFLRYQEARRDPAAMRKLLEELHA
jgi:hypothetical protein